MGHEVYTDFRCFATWCLLAGKRANRSARGGSAAIANMSIENGRPAIFEAQKLTFTRRKIDATMAVGTVRLQQHSTTYRFPHSFLPAIPADLDIANLPPIFRKYGFSAIMV